MALLLSGRSNQDDTHKVSITRQILAMIGNPGTCFTKEWKMYLSILIVCGREEEADGGMVPRLLIYLFIYLFQKQNIREMR